MNAPSRFDDLLRRWSDAEASVEELAELEGLLRSDARYRRALVRLVRLDVDLYARYARSAAPEAGLRPGRNLQRVAAMLAVGLSIAAAAWLMLRAPADPGAWRVASGVIRVAGEPAGTLEPGQAFETGSAPVRLALGSGTLDLDPSTSGRRESVDVLRLERGGGSAAVSEPLRVETPAGTVLSRQGRFVLRIEEVPASLTVRLDEGEADVLYGGRRLSLRPGPPLRLGGPRMLDRTKKADELLRGATFDLATAVDRVAAGMPGVPVKAEVEDEKGRPAFAVEMVSDGKLRERMLDVATGGVLEDEDESDDKTAIAERIRVPLAVAIRTSAAAVAGRAVQAVSDLRDGAPRARVEVAAAEGVFEVVVDLERGHVVSITR